MEDSRHELAMDLFQQAYVLQMQGDLEIAVQLYRKSIELYPTAEAYTFLGWTYSFQGRIDEAKELVFAGPKRWQVESYWLMYSDHDALASYILDSAGQHGEAVSRLRNRSELFGEAEEALKKLTRGAN